ncbi:MAG: hypothetical protein VB858_00545 [Planctomycetaceae bacterium]
MRSMLLLLLLLAIQRQTSAQTARLTGDNPGVQVTAATRLDWMSALANQSPSEVPAGWLSGYDSQQQTYELSVPPAVAARKQLSLIVFIPPSARSNISRHWGTVCRKRGVLLAGVHAAGNSVDMPGRVRIVMDVLDDIRRRFPVDPDRTYLAGFSGGGRVACSIAFALPEYFGGVIPVCAGGSLRPESWLRQRVIERLSIAQLTGEKDFNRGECERLHQTEMDEIGVRCRTWVTPGLGHGIPDGNVLQAALGWLEEGLADRRRVSAEWPASSQAAALTREERAAALLAEGRLRLKTEQLFYSGLMQIKGVHVRWNDLPQAKMARQILIAAQTDSGLSWEQQDIAEQRRFLIARARAVDAYASGPLPGQYAQQKSSMLKTAVQLWEQVVQDGQDASALAEAARRLPVLRKILRSE